MEGLPIPDVTVNDPIPVGVGAQTSAIAYGEGGVWVAYYQDDGNHLARIDPGTGKVVDDIKVDTGPSWESGGGGLTVGDGSVWLTGGSGRGSLLVRVDPVAGRVTADIELGEGWGADVVVDASGVWVMSFARGGDGPVRVDRVDPATNQVVATIPLQEDYGHFLVAVGGRIVAQTNQTSKDREVGGAVLYFIYSTTNAIARREPIGFYAWPAVGDVGAQLWLNAGPDLIEMDPATGDVIAQFAVPSTGDAISVGAGGVWFLAASNRAAIHLFDPATGQVGGSVDIPGSSPVAFAVAPHAIWVLNYDGTVIQVQLH